MNLEHIAQFIDLVNNSDKYSARLKELQEHEKNIKAALELSASASELEKLKVVQRNTNKIAEEKLAEATATAAAKIASAEKYYDAKIEELNKREEVLTAKANNFDCVAKQAQEALAIVEGSKKNLKNKEEQLKAWELRVIAKEQELDARLAKLKSVMV